MSNTFLRSSKITILYDNLTEKISTISYIIIFHILKNKTLRQHGRTQRMPITHDRIERSCTVKSLITKIEGLS